MPASIETLKMMSTDHAINALRADFDPLTGTELEAFLIELLEALADNQDPELEATMANNELETEDIANLADALIEDVPNTIALLDVLSEAGIDTPATLKEKLKCADDFYNLATDGEEVFVRLAALAQSTI